MHEEIINKVAKKVFQLFIANPKAIAIQQDSGNYITKYLSFDYTLIANMYKRKGSAGCYQQGFKNNKIKWICLDFDCKDSENPDVDSLLDYLKKSILEKLNILKINYLLEFSGRRGIHVWILFSTPITKENGFCIISELCKDIDIPSNYGLDKFPATDSSFGNKVGKQVKIPLSFHKKGKRSFFLENNSFQNINNNDFYTNQLTILENYKTNSIEYVNEKLKIDINSLYIQKKYKKIIICNSTIIEIDNIKECLSQIKIFRNLFERLNAGLLFRDDWNVLLGTFGPLDENGDILNTILSSSLVYDEQLTKKNIKKWKQYYFPPTFGYLSTLYNLELESFVNKDDTVFDYIKSKIKDFNFDDVIKKVIDTEYYTNIDSIIYRERNYFLNNDENISVEIYNHFNDLSNFDKKFLEENSKNLNSAKTCFPCNYIIYERKESDEKTRTMVSLDVYDRVITSQLALKLAEKIHIKFEKSESFSYKIADLSRNEIFYNWYSGWSLFVDKIKSYLEIPFFDNWGVFYIDLRHFYDSIDFTVLNNLILSDLTTETKKIYDFLISDYNENLMRKINKDFRKGVPQGPAYARIISEIFLDKIIYTFEKQNSLDFVLYRYVDDIVVFYPENTDGKQLYENLINLFELHLLQVNEDKSFFGGQISNLTQEEKDRILHKDKLTYLLQENTSSILLTPNQEKEIFNDNIGNEFNLDYVSYIFNYKTKENVKWKYYIQFKDEIFSSEYGRGSIFYKFYKHVLSHDKYFDLALIDNNFKKIPIDSLNFKNLISSLYFAIQEENINTDLLRKLYQSYLSNLITKEINTEEKNILQSIKYYLENYDTFTS